MRQQQPQRRIEASGIFGTGEPVIQSHPLLPQAQAPQFGDTAEWNLNGVVRRPARLHAAAWTLVFSHELAAPSWNLLARELSMIMLNPRHPAVTATGLSLKPAPAHPTSVISELSHLRRLARWAEQDGLPHELGAWHDNDLRRLVRDLRGQLSVNSVRQYIGTLKMLHRYAPALTGHGLLCDPWAGKSAREAAQAPPSAVVSTPVIPPEQWFPLIRAAWTYVHRFAPDILRARQRYQDLLAQATAITADRDIRLNRWLEDPHTPIPVHAGSGRVNWGLLTVMLGWKQSCTATVFARNRATGRERMARFDRAIANGHPTTTGVIDDLAVAGRGDGTTNAWHPGLAPALSHWNCVCCAMPATCWSWRCR